MIRMEPRAAILTALCLLLSACGGDKNAPPTAAPIAISTTEDVPVQGAFSGTDPEGKPLTAAVASAPLKGSVVISPTNPLAFTYTPTLNANGTDTFTYAVNDG